MIVKIGNPDSTGLMWAQGYGDWNTKTSYEVPFTTHPLLQSMFDSSQKILSEHPNPSEPANAANKGFCQPRHPGVPHLSFPPLPKLSATNYVYDPLLTPSLRTPSQTIYPMNQKQVSPAGSENLNYGLCSSEFPSKFPFKSGGTVKEVCNNFLRDRCNRGQDCPRIHTTVSINHTQTSPSSQIEHSSINDKYNHQIFSNTTPPVTGCVSDFRSQNDLVSPAVVSAPGREICRRSLRNECPYGNRCIFIHPYQRRRASKPPTNLKSEEASDTCLFDTTTSKKVDLAQPDSNFSEPSSEGHPPLISNERIDTFADLDADFDCRSQNVAFEHSRACVVKLPVPRHRRKQHLSLRCRQRTTSFIFEESEQTSSSFLSICTGMLDTSLFSNHPNISINVVRLPSLHHHSDTFGRTEDRIVQKYQWDPGTDARQRRDRKHSQMSDTSNDSVSDIFSNASSTLSSAESEATTLNSEDDTFTGHKICRYWVSGHCRQGNTCKFKHCEGPTLKVSCRWTCNADHKAVSDGSLYHDRLRGPTSMRQGIPKIFQTSSIFLSKPPPNRTVNISKHSKVKFGPGFKVLEVTTGFESRWILIENLPSSVTLDAVAEILEPFGEVTDMRKAGRTSVRAQFADFAEVVQAATILNGARVFDQTITACPTMNNTKNANGALKDTTVLLLWNSPESVGYAGYASLSEARAAISAANILLRGSFVTATLYQGLPAIGAFNVRFHGLPPDAVAKDVESFGHPEAVMLERPNYLSLDGVVKGIRALLEELGDVTFEMAPPPHKDGIVRAWATFSSPPIAKAAAEYMNSRRQSFIRRCNLRAFHMKTISYTLSLEKYAKIADDIDALRQNVWRRFGHCTSIRVKKDHFYSTVYIKLSGDNLQDLCWLKSEIEAILHGETIRQDGKAAWDRFFSQPIGRTYLDDLERQHPSVFIRTDFHRRHITVVGSSAHRAMIRDRILGKIAELNRQKVRVIPLAGRIFGFFMSVDLLSLQRRLGPENVVLDHLGRTLSIRGNDNAFELAQHAVRRAEADQGRPRQDVVECPVCFHEVSSPVTLECGHSWCKACLCGYLTAAIDNKLFPLTCLGNAANCPQLISITTAHEILPAKDFDAILHASFAAYVHSRPDEFHYCPTPDCRQIYRLGPQNTALQCPSCLIRICPNCRVEYHDGMECADRNGRGEKEFQEWTKEHDVKYCPGCRAPIERSEGCNHMTCTRCHTHICWVCMKTFPKGEGIYDHMRQEHGGIGI